LLNNKKQLLTKLKTCVIFIVEMSAKPDIND